MNEKDKLLKELNATDKMLNKQYNMMANLSTFHKKLEQRRKLIINTLFGVHNIDVCKLTGGNKNGNGKK